MEDFTVVPSDGTAENGVVVVATGTLRSTAEHGTALAPVRRLA
jgi:hypothetical protein